MTTTLETASSRFWRIWKQKQADVEARMKDARPQIPREGIPDPTAVMEYARLVARAKAWEEVRIFLLNMWAPEHPHGSGRVTVTALNSHEEAIFNRLERESSQKP